MEAFVEFELTSPTLCLSSHFFDSNKSFFFSPLSEHSIPFNLSSSALRLHQSYSRLIDEHNLGLQINHSTELILIGISTILNLTTTAMGSTSIEQDMLDLKKSLQDALNKGTSTVCLPSSC